MKIYVYSPHAKGQWSLEELTWADPSDLTPVYLMPTIDPRIAHQINLPSALANALGYNTAAGWYEKGGTTQLPSLPNMPKSKPLLFAATHFSAVFTRRLMPAPSPRCKLARTLTYSPDQAIKTRTSSNLPIHDQVWAYQGTSSK